jgi:hypothetical protein
MKLTPGELYFIRERDKQTNEISRYVKIGLVKEKNDRAAKERALEHQTGNPRELLIHAVIKTPAISEIEKIVHGLFAPERVSGEWFDFSDVKLREAISTAQELANEANLYADEMRNAAKLAKQISSNEVIQPNTEALAWHGAFLRAEAISKYCNDFASSMKDIFRKKAEQRPESVQRFATFRERKDKLVFDAASFKLVHPDLFQQFTKKSKPVVSSRLTWTRPKDFNRAIEVLHPELYEYGKSLEPQIASARNGTLDSETLHKCYLKILGFEARASWQLEIAKANIQFLCSTHGGIDGICKWTRAEKETKSFDEPEFIKAFPDIAKQFMVSESQTAALIIDPRQGY